MNRSAAAEMAAADLDAVIVKGDLSCDGTDDEFSSFESCYREMFGDRLHVVRGNHDAYRGQHVYTGDEWIELAGVSVALLDTVLPERTPGSITATQLQWLDDHAATADRPVLVMGHHQQWISGTRHNEYFGLDPDSSDALTDVVSRRSCIVAYTAGHTHRHRVRQMSCGVPTIEIGCVKDFPGTWAEYCVYEGGVTQIVHRMSSPEALSWSERCRHLMADFDFDYEAYALGHLEDRCFNIPLR
jgi:3',5'-cyclic-AMP phosphodiesterase